MRRLILMRHAKAERASPTGEDFDRPLSAGGAADAALMGQVLADQGLAPDVALVSSALRTRQTWDAAAQAFSAATPRFSRALYLSEADEILSAVETEEEADTVMVVAHNPGLHVLAMNLLTQASAPPSVLAKFGRGFPTASVAVFAIDEAGRAQYDGLFLAADHGGSGGE